MLFIIILFLIATLWWIKVNILVLLLLLLKIITVYGSYLLIPYKPIIHRVRSFAHLRRFCWRRATMELFDKLRELQSFSRRKSVTADNRRQQLQPFAIARRGWITLRGVSMWLFDYTVFHKKTTTLIIRPPGTLYSSEGLMFYQWCFFSFATRSPSSLGRSPWNFATWPLAGWIL